MVPQIIIVPDDYEDQLINAIRLCNQYGGGIISLASHGLYRLRVIDNLAFGGNGLPVVTSAITIEGNNATIIRDPAAPGFRFFSIADSLDPYSIDRGTATLILKNITLKGGLATGKDDGDILQTTVPATNTRDGMGGAIYNQGNLVLMNVTLTANIAQGGKGGAGLGAALFNYHGNTFMLGCTFGSNKAVGGIGAGNGLAAIFNLNSYMHISNITYSANAGTSGTGLSNNVVLCNGSRLDSASSTDQKPKSLVVYEGANPFAVGEFDTKQVDGVCDSIIIPPNNKVNRVVISTVQTYGIDRQPFGPCQCNLDMIGLNNLATMSILIPDGWYVTLYEKRDFLGRSFTSSTNAPNLSDLGFVPSSIVIAIGTPVLSVTKPTLFTGTAYTGQSQTFDLGTYDVGQLTIGNDNISSLLIPPGLVVVLYADQGTKGKSRVFTGNIPLLGDFDKITSSLMVRQVPVVYSGPNYTGNAQIVLAGGSFDINVLTIGNTVGSFRVPTGWTVTLYDAMALKGNSIQIKADTPVITGLTKVISFILTNNISDGTTKK